MTTTRFLSVGAALLTLCCGTAAAGQDKSRGFLDNPPVFITSEPDIPLTGMGIGMPLPGEIVPDIDIVSVESDTFRDDTRDVQPALDVEINTYRIGALRGFNDGWAAGISIPWNRKRVRGQIGGLPATGVGDGFGDITLIAKKTLWTKDHSMIVATAGIELPTGKDDATFAQSNAVTNGYYRGDQHRMPLGWQTGSGTLDGYLAIAYGRSVKRLSYVALFAAKLQSSGDQGVSIGNIFIGAASATYGISRNVAFSLGLTLRAQEDDSYPEAPPPGVTQVALAGTTLNGATLYLDPSVRVRIARRFTAGVGLRYPIVKPDEGMVPDVAVSFIFYPEF